MCKGTAKNCDDGNPCTTDSCDATTGQCTHTNVADGSTCDDGNACTENDTCQAGVCKGTAKNCDDGNVCTTDSCDPATGKCVNTNADGTACDDGDACTENDQCQAGVCKGTAKDCDDGNACTTDSCDQNTGKCVHTNVDDGTACDDGDACTENDQCSAGVCQGTVKNCDDGNTCTTDSCDQSTGECKHVNVSDGTACNDGNACTINDSCVNGKCQGGAPLDCSKVKDLNTACTVGVCDPKAGGCIAQPKKDGTTCDDSNACTINDKCVNGQCRGENKVCDDGNACTVDFCDPKTGKCVNNAMDDGTKCGDCMICSAGKCVQDESCPAQGNGSSGGGCSYSTSSTSMGGWILLLLIAGFSLLMFRRKREEG